VHPVNNEASKDSFNVAALVAVLRRRFILFIAIALVIPAAVVVWSQRQEKTYTAVASLLFRDPGLDQQVFGVFEAPRDPEREAATNIKLVSLDVVAERTSRHLEGRLSAAAVASKVETEPEGESDIVTVRASDSDPEFAAELANTFAGQYIAFRREADQSKVRAAQEVVQRELAQVSGDRRPAQARSLREREQQLEILASLQTGNAELVQPAQVPGSPASPRVTRNAVVGVVVGLLVALLAALAAERFDRRIRDPGQIEDILGQPNLGGIPDSRALARGGPAQRRLPGREEEAFMTLRANLRYFNVDHAIRSILVISAVPEEGKSTVAWNLARVAASAGERVLVVEADLRRPRFAASGEVSPSPGLSTVLAGQATLVEVAQMTGTAELRSPAGNHRRLDVVVAGPLPRNPTPLIDSKRMLETIHEAEQAYDLVVIDTPPTSIVSDAIPLVRGVSGVLVVARLGKTPREQMLRLRDQLANLHAPVLGVVVNSMSVDGRRFGYRHGYYRQGGDRDHPRRGGILGHSVSGAAGAEEVVDQGDERPAGPSPTVTAAARARAERSNVPRGKR
jgi:succinoglycan biosynthesis transport protein ExoP